MFEICIKLALCLKFALSVALCLKFVCAGMSGMWLLSPDIERKHYVAIGSERKA